MLTVDITIVHRFYRHRSLILGPSISTIIFSKPDSLFPTDLFAFGKSGREKISLEFGVFHKNVSTVHGGRGVISIL